MGRTPCCDKNGLKKGPWTSEEDLLLTQYVQVHGPGNWRALPKDAGLKRCGKSCRLRWTNYLRPDIKRGRFAFEEEEAIIQLHSVLGNKWSAIAARLPGRTDNEIKNYWNTHIRKRLLRMGIDPVTHGPRLDLLELSSILGRNNPSDLNTLSSLLGVQSSPPSINPEWYLTLANTILSLKQQDPEILLRKIQQENQILLNSQLENQILSSLQFQPNGSFPIATNAPASATTSTAPQPNVENSSQLQQHSQENLIPSNWNADFQSLEIGNPNFGFDSVMSTPLSSPRQVNSSTAIRHSGTEDERESYCSDVLMKFEIPESLDISEFL